MSQTINYAIDLGTTNSAIAHNKNGEVVIFKNPSSLKQTIPSVVGFRNDRILVGEKARELLSRKPDQVFATFKRKMGTNHKYIIGGDPKNTIGPVELSSIVLKELKKFIHTNDNPQEVVITIPAAFDSVQCKATQEAGGLAGFRNVVLLQEPIAASLAFANRTNCNVQNGCWLVYDLGGGTFDIALASIINDEMKILDHEGDNYLGGKDFDSKIIDEFIIPELRRLGSFSDLENQLKRFSGRYNALYGKLLFISEEAKISLSHAEEADIEFDIIDDDGKEIDVFLTLTRSTFEDIVRPDIQATLDMVETVLNRNRLTDDQLTCILLIGGSTYMPCVASSLKDRFDIEIYNALEPTSAVVEGASYFASQKLCQIKDSHDSRARSGKTIENSDIQVRLAYERVTKSTVEYVISQMKGELGGAEFKIFRTDGGYDSGLIKCSELNHTSVPLLENYLNRFEFLVYDKSGNEILQEYLTINHGQYSIGGQTLPAHICIELDSPEDGCTFLEPVFHKNDLLPLKKTIVKQVSHTIKRGSEEVMKIKILEGDIDVFPSANKLIGYIAITGDQLERDLIKNTDVELTFEMSESRELTVEAYLTLTDQEYTNTFEITASHVDAQLLIKDLKDLERRLRVKMSDWEIGEQFELASEGKDILDEIRDLKHRVRALHEDDTTETIYQLESAKRVLAKRVFTLLNDSLLSKVIIEYLAQKKRTITFIDLNYALEEDRKSFYALVKNEKDFLQSGSISLIRMKCQSLISIAERVMDRRPPEKFDFMAYFITVKLHEFKDQDRADKLIEKGDKAIRAQNDNQLQYVVYELISLINKEQEASDDDMGFEGTGLR